MRALSLERHELTFAGGRPLVYHAAGSGPAVLMMNGLGASHLAYRAQVEHLAGRYRCLLWDYRGLFDGGAAQGRGRASIARHAQDAAAILRAEGVGRAAVIGWSFGVQVALQLFADAPSSVAALVLVGGGASAPWSEAGASDWLRRAVPRVIGGFRHVPSWTEALLKTVASSPEVSTWARRLGIVGPTDRELLADVLRALGDLDVEAALGSMRDMERCDLGEVLDAVDVPVLVIGGDRDPFTPRGALERMVQRVAGAEYLLLPGGTHFVLLDRAEHVNLRIDKFFSERGYGA